MNKTNVQHAINIMKRAGELDMCGWQDTPTNSDVFTLEEELHKCGTAACFGGWVAVSEEFRSDGGFVCDALGEPMIQDPEFRYKLSGSHAIAEWLGVSNEEGEYLCATDLNCGNTFYGKMRSRITKEDVITKLEELRDTGALSIEQD